MSTLNLSLLGPFQASLGKRPVDQFRTNKVQALLIFLAVESDGVHKREALMTLLWPGLPLKSARTNLRQILYQLRKAIPDLDSRTGDKTVPFLLTKGQNVQLNPQAAVDLDVHKFETLLQESRAHPHADLKNCAHCQDRLEQATALYRGDFLVDFFLSDSNEFEHWAQVRREAYKRHLVDSFATLAQMHMQPGHYPQAQTYARRQLEIDNLNENATRQLMEALARNGRRSEALSVYEGCRQLLAGELGMAPTAKTTLLYRQILDDNLTFEITQTPQVRGYELLEEIGHGAFGVVHRAYQNVIGREVAIKIYQPNLANQPDFIRSFDAEMEITARLEHPHIVPVYDFWREPDNAYLVMRYLRGGSLRKALEEGPWSLSAAAALIEQIASALAITHRQGIIHRDIKPANILLDEEGNAYISDFGIAKDLDREEWQTLMVGLKGTPQYASPEQLLFEDLSPQSDQFSLGIVIYELISGKRPFSQKAIAEMLRMQIYEPLPLLSDQYPHIPPAIDLVLQRATAKKAPERYPSISAFARAFREAAQNSIEIYSALPGFLVDQEMPNPYKGLHAFQEADAQYFFGREELVGRLLEKLSGSRFLAVVGASGSGKSSVVKAGLLPALRKGALPGSAQWFIAEMTPGSHPLEELEAALLPVAVNPPPSLLEPLQKDERGLVRTLKRILPVDKNSSRPGQLLLVVDQFEELFTMVKEPELRRLFLNNLLAGIKDPYSRLHVIITLRADFYDRPLQEPELGELMRRCSETILPMNSAELELAVSGPAVAVGAQLEPGLARLIAADVTGQPGALPLLQYALTELFDRRVGHVMAQEVYLEIGGVLGALAQRAEEIYQEFNPTDQGTICQQFLRLVTLGEGTEDTRRRVPLAELEDLAAGPEAGRAVGDTWEPLQVFGRFRLLTFDRDPINREPTVEIAHESLLREWPRLAGWLDESRDDVRQQRLLAAAAAEWLKAGRDESFLLRGGRLDQFSDWLRTSSVSLTLDEQEFLAASSIHRLALEEEENARRQREIDTAHQLAETEKHRAEEQTLAAQRLRRRAYFLIAALFIAALLAGLAFVNGSRAGQNAQTAQENLALAVSREAEAVANAHLAATQEALANENAQLAATRQSQAEAEALARATAESAAINEREIAQEQADFAKSRELALAALNNLEADPELSILLALQALETSYTKEAEEALHRGLQNSRVLKTVNAQHGGVWGSVYSPDGRLLATAGDDLNIKIWDVASGDLLHTLTYDGVEYLGSTLDFNDASNQLAIIAVAQESANAVLHTWDVQTGDRLSQVEIPSWVGNFIGALSPDWQWIAVGHDDGVAELWAVGAKELVRSFSGYNDRIASVDFNSDGTQLMIAGEDGQVTIWGLAAALDNPNSLPELSFQSPSDGSVNGAYFSNSGQLAALIFGQENKVEIWNLADPFQAQAATPIQTNAIHYVRFHPDDSLILTGSADATAKVWDSQTGELLFTLAGHKGFVTRPNFSPDGRTIVTPGLDGSVRIWDAQLQYGGELLTIPLDNMNYSIDLSPDGEQLVVGSLNGPAVVLDAANGEKLLSLPGDPDTGVYSAVFHPDSSKIAAAGEDGQVRVWDAQSGGLLLEFSAHAGGSSGGFITSTVDVAYSPDGRRLVTAGADGLAKVWDAQTGQNLLTLSGHSAGLFRAIYSPDGRLIATTSDVGDTSVRVWNAESGQEIYNFGPNPGRTHAATFSPDGQLLSAGGAQGYIKIWDLSSGQEIGQMLGQSETIGNLIFTPDNRYIVSGGESISVWDVAEGVEIIDLAAETNRRFDLDNDGRRIFSNMTRPLAVGVFILNLEDAIELAQSRLTRTLTDDECRQYLHVDTCPSGLPPGS